MRLIDADALDEKLQALTERYAKQGRIEVANDYNFVATVIMTAPTIDTENPRPQGEWIDLYGGEYANHRYACSVCGIDALYKFEVDALGHEKAVQALSESCPHCGAKMKGADDHA